MWSNRFEKFQLFCKEHLYREFGAKIDEDFTHGNSDASGQEWNEYKIAKENV